MPHLTNPSRKHETVTVVENKKQSNRKTQVSFKMNRNKRWPKKMDPVQDINKIQAGFYPQPVGAQFSEGKKKSGPGFTAVPQNEPVATTWK